MLGIGCSKKAAPATETPADAGGMPAADEAAASADDGAWADPLADYEVELEHYEDALLDAGVALPEGVAQARADEGKAAVADAAAGGDATPDHCQRRCTLATNICDLRGRICALADEHGGDARYARVCERATLDCEHATEACEDCEG